MEAGAFRQGGPPMSTLVCLLEELSAEAMLRGIGRLFSA